MTNETTFYDAQLYSLLSRCGFADWIPGLKNDIQQKIFESNNGNLSRWLDAYDQLPDIISTDYSISESTIRAGSASDSDLATIKKLETQLRSLIPWRKGPYQLFDININTEWRSDWKWDRLISHISPLEDKVVLDVGCGSGYHSWRMAGENARLVLGIDPSLLFVMQYRAIRKYIPDPPVYVLPFKLEEMPLDKSRFDTIFSMGVLYHRKSPFDHFSELMRLLKPGGELIMETLVIPGGDNTVLVPQDRYAKMRNVWFLPSEVTLKQWMSRAGFKNIQVVDVNQTSTEEQRVTDWMQFESLEHFLDPGNKDLTIEGYPAPRRAIVVAEKNHS